MRLKKLCFQICIKLIHHWRFHWVVSFCSWGWSEFCHELLWSLLAWSSVRTFPSELSKTFFWFFFDCRNKWSFWRFTIILFVFPRKLCSYLVLKLSLTLSEIDIFRERLSLKTVACWSFLFRDFLYLVNDIINVVNFFLSCLSSLEQDFSDWDSEDTNQWLMETCKDVIIDLTLKFWAVQRIVWQVHLEINCGVDSWICSCWTWLSFNVVKSSLIVGRDKGFQIKNNEAFFDWKQTWWLKISETKNIDLNFKISKVDLISEMFVLNWCWKSKVIRNDWKRNQNFALRRRTGT